MYCITCLNCTLKKNLQYINLLNKLGLCVSADAAEKKKSDLSSRQKSHIEHMFLAEKKIQLRKLECHLTLMEIILTQVRVPPYEQIKTKKKLALVYDGWTTEEHINQPSSCCSYNRIGE